MLRLPDEKHDVLKAWFAMAFGDGAGQSFCPSWGLGTQHRGVWAAWCPPECCAPLLAVWATPPAPHLETTTWHPQPGAPQCPTAHLGPAKVRERGLRGIQGFVKSNGPEEKVQPHVCCCGGVLKRWSPEPKPPIWNKTKSVTAIKKGLKRAKLFQTCM